MAKSLPCPLAVTTTAIFRFNFAGYLKNAYSEERKSGLDISGVVSDCHSWLNCHHQVSPWSPFLLHQYILGYFIPIWLERVFFEMTMIFNFAHHFLLLKCSRSSNNIVSFDITSPQVAERINDITWGFTVLSDQGSWGYLSSTSRVPPALEWLPRNVDKFKDPV